MRPARNASRPASMPFFIARAIITGFFAAAIAVFIYFPDPWPKKRHHKRRLIQLPFAGLLASRLVPGGYLHVATDWQEYADHILATLQAVPALENPHGGFAARPADRPETKFEQRGRRLGHGSWDVIVRRRADPGEDSP